MMKFSYLFNAVLIFVVIGNADERSVFKVIIGTHESKGLFSSSIDSSTGKLAAAKQIKDVGGTGVVSRSTKNGHIYTCGPSKESKELGLVQVFKNGQLVDASPSYGNGPCYVALDTEKKYLFVANIGNGIVTSFKLTKEGLIDAAVTKLAIAPKKKSFKPHAAVLSRDGRFLFVPDIGGGRICRIAVNRETGELSYLDSVESKDFTGPRHFAFDQEGKTAYLVNQMGEAVTVFSYKAETGELKQIGHEQSLPDDQLQINNHIAEIKIHPSGKFVYVSNRGHDSLTLYNRDPETGLLKFVECVSSEGKAPWSFAIGPQGRFLYCSNRKSDNVAVFTLNPENGKLKFTGQTISVPAPASVVILGE